MSEDIEKFGVRLRRLTVGDLELVRKWRNDPIISQHMEYRETISPEQQLRWFESVSNDLNIFWIIEIHDQPVGLTNLKNIDSITGSAEGGIFIWDSTFLNSLFAYAVNVSVLDFAFEILQLKTIHARILDTNKRAIRFNRSVGFVPTENVSNLGNRLYILERDAYLSAVKSIRGVLMSNLS